MRTSRLLAILGAILLPLSLAACGGGDEEAVEGEAVESAEVAEAPLDAPPEGPIADPVDATAANLPEGVTTAMVEEGRQLYGTVCMACHGPTGTGTALAPDLTDEEWVNIGGDFDEIVRVIHEGVPTPQEYPAPMPPMGGGNFNEDQVRALAAYVWTLSHT